MVVLAKSVVKAAAIRHPGCAQALNEWYAVTRAASWKDFLAVKQTYRNTDYVAPDRLVFDVCGNRLRVIRWCISAPARCISCSLAPTPTTINLT